MAASIYVVGHSPPPVTGENLCRRQLIETLTECGHSVVPRARLSLRNFSVFRQCVWLLSGSKKHGHIRDVFFVVWWLLCGNLVSVYIHNISWVYFLRSAWLWRLFGGRLRFVVLTDSICRELLARRLYAVRLNNTLSDGVERDVKKRGFRPRLVWMSAVTAEKGFSTAYELLVALRKLNPHWTLDVYGSGPMVDSGRFPLASFHGFISGEGKEAAFDAGGILILPSRYLNETQPLAIIEALNHSLPFLGSDIGGLRAMLGDQDLPAGICLPVASSLEEWVAAVMKIHENYESYSIGANKTYAELFSRGAFRRALLDLQPISFCG